ncbi:UTRA domain-containing protein [Streptomyces sp. NBC_01298]|uniref:GntR family transcriptional regulator n=1 Tax=Streptomyces sp. NBC_01298 TaxID=2903817 RepID=UPI002E0E0180|nr:UTRA domain-containing protein [Streptomyces sp. NBC_01298]
MRAIAAALAAGALAPGKCHSVTLVPAERAPGIGEPDYTTASLYTELTARGVAPTRASYTVHSALVPPDEAPLLELPEGAPVLHIEQLTYDQHGRPYEFNRVVYRANRYRFHATLTAESRRGPEPRPLPEVETGINPALLGALGKGF